MSKLAIIITSFVSNPFQETMLVNCLNSAQKVYPEATIVILNDNHQRNLKLLLENHNVNLDNIEIVLSSAPRSGECNAYIWASEAADKYDMFLFIHDSTLLLGQIPELAPETIWKPLWYADCSRTNIGMGTKDIIDIVEALNIDGSTGPTLYNMIASKQIHVTFGGMGYWTKEFSKYLRDKTNIKEVLPRCNNRHRRCALERIISIIFHISHPNVKRDQFKAYASCGDIYKHGACFKNKDTNPELARNPYVLKIWQGR